MKQMLNENQKETMGVIGRVTKSIQILATTVLSVIIFADGIIEWMLGNSVFFGGVPPTFKVVLGFITIVLASEES